MCFSRQEVNRVVTQQIERGEVGCLTFAGCQLTRSRTFCQCVFVELGAKVTLITSLSEFIDFGVFILCKIVNFLSSAHRSDTCLALLRNQLLYSPTFNIDHFVVGRQPSCPTCLSSREVSSVTTHRQHWLPATTLCLPVDPSASFLGESEAACFRDQDTIVRSIAHSPIIRLRRSRGYLRRSLCQPKAWTSSGQSDYSSFISGFSQEPCLSIRISVVGRCLRTQHNADLLWASAHSRRRLPRGASSR